MVKSWNSLGQETLKIVPLRELCFFRYPYVGGYLKMTQSMLNLGTGQDRKH